jgi:hypothetical protein
MKAIYLLKEKQDVSARPGLNRLSDLTPMPIPRGLRFVTYGSHCSNSARTTPGMRRSVASLPYSISTFLSKKIILSKAIDYDILSLVR